MNEDMLINSNNIHSVDINLLDGQVELILRSLELYSYNLEYMLKSSNKDEEFNQEKKALVRYTYEQVLASQAEQIESKANNIDNIPEIGKKIIDIEYFNKNLNKISKVV